MELVSWNKISDYLAAGNLVEIRIDESFTGVSLAIIYGNNKTVKEAHIQVTCADCSYVDWRRTDDHKDGSGIILDAYLHDNSSLINDLHSHKLQGVAGTLPLEDAGQEVKHFEVVGEVSVNILCKSVRFEAEGLPIVEV